MACNKTKRVKVSQKNRPAFWELLMEHRGIESEGKLQQFCAKTVVVEKSRGQLRCLLEKRAQFLPIDNDVTDLQGS